jgi:hypothetical protein
MGTAKEEVRRLLDRLPDDGSYEDIQYHIYVRERIERGLREAEQGLLMAQEDVEREFRAEWLSGNTE